MSDIRPTHRQIEAFRALMLSQSMTEAARHLSVTQSAVSKIISQLEEELGFSLFDRRQGKLSPTDEAHILYSEVEQSYSGLERVIRAAKRIKNRTGGNLRIAVMPAMATGFIVHVIQNLYKNSDNAYLSFQAYGSEEIVDLVASGLYDLGLTTTPIDSTRIHSGPVMSVPSFCILPPDHHLLEKQEISVSDLDGEKFIATAEGTPSRIRIDSLFASMNVAREVFIEARWSLSISELVQAGLGCSIVDGFTASTFADRGGIVRPLKEKLDFAFVSVAPQSSPSSSLVKQFHEIFEVEFRKFKTGLLTRKFK
ncbi:MAG: LysR substrate-binding domain-containing protein [Hyphomicrobiales bacterium]